MNTVQVHPSVYRIATPYEGNGVVFLYLLKGDQVALIDTGSASSPFAVLPSALAEIGMALSDVDVILNTHGHLDHAGGNAAAKRASNARIFMHPVDVPLSQDLRTEIEFHTASLRALDFPQSFIQARGEYISITAGSEKVPVDATLADGDTLDLGKGIRLSVIHTPGHTPGHVCFFWESEGVLLTGDAIQGQGSRPGGYPYYFDAPTYRRSLAAMEQLNPQVVCMGHAYGGGGYISDPTRVGDDANAILRESMRVADAMHQAVSTALNQKPGATRREIALAALAELVYDLPQWRLRETQMPGSAGPTLFTHIEAAIAGSYPA